MSIVCDHHQCPQCNYANGDTEYNCRTNESLLQCRRCGFSDELTPTWVEEEQRYTGYRRELRDGAGAMWYRGAGCPAYCANYFSTQKEVEKAEEWLRKELAEGGVETDSAYLTRWNRDTKMVELVIGTFFEWPDGTSE